MLVLDPGPRSVHQARTEAQTVCARRGFDAERCAAVALVVSELVGNAVRHARAPVHLDLTLDGADLLIVVQDSDEHPPDPRATCPPADRESGRGMFLVEQMSRCWGWQPLPGGKQVWARL